MAALPELAKHGGSMLDHIMTEFDLDREWMELMKEAKNLGLSLNEIREFLSAKSEDQ